MHVKGTYISCFALVVSDLLLMIHIAYTITFVLVKCTMFNAMGCEGKHFQIQRIDDKRNTQDCGVIRSFEEANGKIDDY